MAYSACAVTRQSTNGQTQSTDTIARLVGNAAPAMRRSAAGTSAGRPFPGCRHAESVETGGAGGGDQESRKRVGVFQLLCRNAMQFSGKTRVFHVAAKRRTTDPSLHSG